MPIRGEPPFTVAIDPGHGGPFFFGATYRDGEGNLLIEKDLTLDIALRLDSLLRGAGYNTVLTREGDYTLVPFYPEDYRGSLVRDTQARVDRANKEQADILVSIHFNGSEIGSLSGTEVYYNPDRGFGYHSYALAFFVQRELVSAIRSLDYEVVDRGVKNDALVGGDPSEPHSLLLGTPADFRASLMPGIIAEVLFLSNPEDAHLLLREEARQKIAEGFKAGIDAYFEWVMAEG